jgi:hypothetical protein
VTERDGGPGCPWTPDPPLKPPAEEMGTSASGQEMRPSVKDKGCSTLNQSLAGEDRASAVMEKFGGMMSSREQAEMDTPQPVP